MFPGISPTLLSRLNEIRWERITAHRKPKSTFRKNFRHNSDIALHREGQYCLRVMLIVGLDLRDFSCPRVADCGQRAHRTRPVSAQKHVFRSQRTRSLLCVAIDLGISADVAARSVQYRYQPSVDQHRERTANNS